MSKTLRILAATALAALLATTSACSKTRNDAGDSNADTGPGLVGIAMPTRSLERWNNDGSHLEDLLKKAGYKTSLQYADNKVDQ
ncbi:MAG TPA: ABC transporter substrate-binding protein, partial [Dactylosporangium sp.]|nr:ABC transporter substrate-binding protein [Dactylosporangium sp.]